MLHFGSAGGGRATSSAPLKANSTKVVAAVVYIKIKFSAAIAVAAVARLMVVVSVEVIVVLMTNCCCYWRDVVRLETTRASVYMQR